MISVRLPISYETKLLPSNTKFQFSEILSFRTLSIVLVLKNKQIQFPKRRVSRSLFFNTRTMDMVRKLNISESYTPSSESHSNYKISGLTCGWSLSVTRRLNSFGKLPVWLCPTAGNSSEDGIHMYEYGCSLHAVGLPGTRSHCAREEGWKYRRSSTSRGETAPVTASVQVFLGPNYRIDRFYSI
jgi:hypothetical protein